MWRKLSWGQQLNIVAWVIVLLLLMSKCYARELYAWDIELWKAISRIESNCNDPIYRVGDNGEARGPFQVHYDVAKKFGYKGTRKQLEDPFVSFVFAQKLLLDLYVRFDFDIYKALFAYNAKWPAIKRYEKSKKPFRQSIYVQKIIKVLDTKTQCNSLGF